MTSDEQLDLLSQHYTLNGAGRYAEAEELLTADFNLTIPSYMPFGGVFQGKAGMREAIAAVSQAIKVEKLSFLGTTLGPDSAVKIVEFTLGGDAGSPTQVAELVHFHDRQICRIQPFYSDPSVFVAAAARRKIERL